MNKAQSGLVLIGVAILLNGLGRLFMEYSHNSQSVTLTGFVALVMIGSLVVGLFGMFRLVVGLISKK